MMLQKDMLHVHVMTPSVLLGGKIGRRPRNSESLDCPICWVDGTVSFLLDSKLKIFFGLLRLLS